MSAGKGDKKRPLSKKFDENYERIFGKKCVKCKKIFAGDQCDCEKEA